VAILASLAALSAGAGWLAWWLRTDELASDLVREGNRLAAAELRPRRDLPPLSDGAAIGAYRAAGAALGARARAALATGRADEAVPLCLDGLALARDAASAPGTRGPLVRADLLLQIVPLCAEIAAAPGVDRLDLVPRLRAIRDGAPGLEAALRADGVATQLALFGGLLSPAQRSRLDPRAAALAGPPREPSGDPLIWVAERFTWREVARGYRALAEAARLEPRSRRSALGAVGRRWSRHWAPVVASGFSLDFSSYAILEDDTLLRHDLVILAAAARLHRDRTGAWPARLAELDLSAEERGRLDGMSFLEVEEQLRIDVPTTMLDGTAAVLTATLSP